MNYAMLFKAIIDEGCKNKEDLINAGFTPDKIEELLNSGIISLDNGLTLTAKVIPTLYNYARYLIKENSRVLGAKYLEYVCSVCPDNMDYLKELFMTYLYFDSSKAFACYEKLYHGKYWTGKSHFTDENDMNFFLLLFSCYFKLPEEYKKKADNFIFEELSCENHPDNIFSYTANNIRGAYYSKIFNVATTKIKSIRNNDPTFKTYNVAVLKIFNFLITDFDIRNRKKLNDLILQNRYEEAYNFVSELLHDYRCDNYYTYVYNLLGIVLGKVEPKTVEGKCTSFYEALKKNNFKEAKRLSTENSAISKLLDEILEPKVNSNELYDKFVDSLMSKKIDEALKVLNKYLVSISKSEYEELLINLIKYNSHIGNKLEANVMIALNMIQLDDFSMDLTECYKEFYKRINVRDFEGAKLLLEVIKEATIVLKEDVDVDSLIMMLNDASKYDKYFEHLNNQNLMCMVPYNNDTTGIINEAKLRGIKTIITGEEEKKQIVLIKSSKIEQAKLLELSKELDKSIAEESFSKALNIIEQLIAAKEKLDVSLMIKYTLILNELGMKKEALDAFYISKTLAANENFDYDFNELLVSITGKPKTEEKTTVMEIVNFDKDYESLFDMVALKVSDDNITVTEACQALSFDTFNAGIVLLIYAKRYYMQHNEKKGNEFMNKFNGLPGKDKKLKEFYQSLLSMRSIYLNKEISGKRTALVKA